MVKLLNYFFRIIPESARWLMAKRRNKKAFKIISKAAENNGVELSQSLLENFQESFDRERQEKIKSTKYKKPAYIELLKSKVLVVRCLILIYIW